MNNNLSVGAEILDIKDIAKLLKKSERTIKRYLKNSPSELPPFFRSGRKTLFLHAIVKKWMAKKSNLSIEDIESQILPPPIPNLAKMLSQRKPKI